MKDDLNIPESIRKAGKDLPFKVPDGYFEAFRSRLRDRMQPAEPVSGFSKLARFIMPQLGMAATFAGIILMGFLAYRYIIQSGQQQALDVYELAEIVDYYIADYDEEMLYETINGMEEIPEIRPLKEQSEEIFEYLSEEDIDYSLLIEEY